MASNPSRDRFHTTRWSLIRSAAGGSDRSLARAALEELCELYWRPLYSWLRRNGSTAHEAEDLVQGFYVALLERDDFTRLAPERGRFRSFLLASLRHYVSNQRDYDRAAKRGGGLRRFSLDVDAAEKRLIREPSDQSSQDALYDRVWAETVLERAHERLQAQYATAGRRERYAALAPHLAGAGAQSYARVAGDLGLTEGAVKVAVHRLRQEFRDALRAEIAQTVDEPEEIDAEIQDLFRALRGH